MNHPFAKDRLCRTNLVHMGVEVISAQTGKVHNIRFRQGATRRQQAVARLQLLKVFAERMHAIFLHGCAAHPLLANGRQHGRTALNRRALQVVLHRAQAAQFLTAARATGPAVHQLRQRGAVAGGLFGGFLVEDLNTTVGTCRTGNELAGKG